MGSYTFRWEHPAEEVYVTGTFDDWSKSTLLEKSGSAHEKTIDLPETGEKILYKFVADGNWSYDHTAKSEADESGNLNNVLYPADLKHSSTSKSSSGPLSGAAAAISSVAPGASSTKMAGDQPLTGDREMPGGFPQTPGNELPGAFPETPAPNDAQSFSVNPLPAAPGAVNPIKTAPGDKVPESSTLHNNTLTSNVHDDEELKKQDQESEKAMGVSPLPATGGASNPIHLQPGEKVPDASTITGNTLTSNVKLDKESYEKSDSGAPMLPAFTPGMEKEAAGGSIFGLPSAGGAGTSMIPESGGLPMGDKAVSDLGNMGPTTSSVAPQSSTNELAGQQPIEPRGVPTVVSESQDKANVEPEAAANPEAVQEKSALEEELKQKVPEEPATAESGSFGKSERGVTGAVAGGLAAAGAAAAGGAYALRDKTTAATGTDPTSVLPKAVQDKLPGSNGSQATEGTSTVPAVVSESQEKAHVDPEAAANPEAVQEKSALEQELKSKVPEEPATAESGVFGKSEKGVTGAIAGGAAAATAAVAGGAYALRDKATQSTGKDPVSSLPQSVQDSINNMNSKGTTAPARPATNEPTPSYISKDPTLPQQTTPGGPITVPAEEDATRKTTDTVPEIVAESQKKAHVDPEAAANPTAVSEKQDFEKELLGRVPTADATGEPAPSATSGSKAPLAGAAIGGAALGAGAGALAGSSATGAPRLEDPTKDVSPITMSEPTATGSGLNASADTPAVPPTQTDTSKLAAPETPTKLADSRDVSPMSKVATASHPTGEGEPTVTDGVASSSTPAVSKPVGSRPGVANSTPGKRGSFIDKFKGTPDSSKSGKTTESGTKKKGFFGKIKEKLKQ